MPESSPPENSFLNKITFLVEENIANEQFGVSELAAAMNMSRSNLLRKIKKETKLSVSQLIRQIRLQQGMEMLRKSTLNVSEVSHLVGFGSTSYFIRCFREYYGYSPGEVGKREESEAPHEPVIRHSRSRKLFITGAIGMVMALVLGLFSYYRWSPVRKMGPEKSIAVLPFKNESSDSTNVYLINGLMEATLNNLQKIQDLKVISRTSAEKYRNTTRSIPEMAKELNVNYFVEGSGQKIGNKILLNIQLIDGTTDRHLWARQYRREADDIFELQQEVARNIAAEIQAVITPEERKQIEKNPTNDPVAYDLFLKGKELFYRGKRENLEASIPYFEKAIEHDKEFALAYANMAMVYYYLDIFQTNKQYGTEISLYADKAELFDAKLAESLIAKALFYIHKKEYEQAVPYLEKALEYTPNSGLVLHFLSELYNLHIPNTAKYLEYALMRARLDMALADSAEISYKYVHLSNALIQAGFVDEALLYINKAVDYDPDNYFAGYLRAFILFAKDCDINKTREMLIQELDKDSSRFDLMQEIGKCYYITRDYANAYVYYKRFVEFREAHQLDLFKIENLRVGIVMAKMGDKEKADEFIKSFKQYAENDKSIYRNLSLAQYYCQQGDKKKAIEHLKLFTKEDNYQYWTLLFDNDPVTDPIKDLPEYKNAMRDIKNKFWATHKRIRTTLEGKGLL